MNGREHTHAHPLKAYRLADDAWHRASQAAHGGGHRGHGWMMIACCIPMLVIAVALVATGVVSAGFLVFAVVCTAAMALMMRGMHDDGGHGQSPR